MKSRFLVTAASVLAGVSLASAQGLSGGGAASEKGTSAGQSGGGMSLSAPRASRSGGMRQGPRTESREGGGAEGAARERESGRAQRDEPGTRDRGHAEESRDSGKRQTVGQRRSDRDEARHSQESNKEQRETGKDRAHQQSQKKETVGQGRSDRGETRRSEDRTDSQHVRQPSRQNQSGSGMPGESAQDRNSNSGTDQNVTRGRTDASAQGQTTATGQTQTRTNLTAQQQTTLQKSVLHADNPPRVNVNSVNFQIHTGVPVPSNVSIASVSTYPALIDVFPAYRDYNFFVVEDDVVFVDRDRRIVDVVPAGPRTRFSDGDYGSSRTVAAVNLPPDDIRLVQQVLIERGLLHGEADGVLGPHTREAISAFQRQQGIQVTGSIDARTISSLGLSGRLSQRTNQSIGLSQSSQTGAQPSTKDRGQAGPGQAQLGPPQPSQENATGQAPNETTGPAANPPAQQSQPSTTGQSTAPNQSNTTGRAAQRWQSGNKPTANENAPSDAISLTFTGAAIAIILLALGAFIIMPVAAPF
jgi:peptidoglycan hydrolase-like protein with peptidoglycan-binding domain